MPSLLALAARAAPIVSPNVVPPPTDPVANWVTFVLVLVALLAFARWANTPTTQERARR